MHTLKQIQEYNRKTINHLSAGENITLSKVLLALQEGMVGYAEGYLIETEITEVYQGYETSIHYHCRWRLNKETLEEQEEETQREIFRLLGGHKYQPEEMPTHKGTMDELEDLCNFNKE